jgi:putative Holliday junction resolvase
MRKIALDVGDATIGVAVSDQMGIIAQGLTTIERVGIRKDAGKVMDLIQEYDCDTVILGLPKNMDGTEGIQCQKVREFATMLQNKMHSTGMGNITIDFVDERLTTVMAEKVLISGDVRRSDRKKVIDKQAAVIILQTFLEKGKSAMRTLVLMLCAVMMMSVLFTGCGENTQIVGQWHMTKVLVGDHEYDAASFLDPTNQTDGTFVIQFYGDQTLIATGSLGTIKGASDGEWTKLTEDTFSLTIDGQERKVKLVEDLLFMDVEMEDATLVIIFERE